MNRVAIFNKRTKEYRFIDSGVQTRLDPDEVVLGTQRTLQRKYDLRMCHVCNRKGVLEYT
jgi:hypothetical protein